MKRKLLLFTIAFTFALSSSSSFASPVPPSKGQWAYPLSMYLLLFTKPDTGAGNSGVKMPDEWISVSSTVRDKNNYLWYKVDVDGKSGWLPQNGIRLKMGGKSSSASKLYKSFVKARRAAQRLPREWERDVDDEHGIITYMSANLEGDLFQVREGKKGTEDVFFETGFAETAKKFFGTSFIGMTEPELRKKLGTPTMREAHFRDNFNDFNFNTDTYDSTLSYELADRNMTLGFTLAYDKDDRNGRVISVFMHEGRAGRFDD